MSRKQRDPQPEYRGGAFDDSLRAGMSEQLQRRLAEDDARDEREAAQVERERAVAADVQRERAIAHLVAQAVERGDYVSMHQRATGEGLGNLPSEFVAQRAALMDVEDAKRAAEVRKAFNEFQSQYYADVPNGVECEEGAARAAADAEVVLKRNASARKRRRENAAREKEIRGFIRSDRRLRQMGFRGV